MASAPNFDAKNVSDLAERYLTARSGLAAINDEVEALVKAAELRNPGTDYKLFATDDGAALRVACTGCDGCEDDYQLMRFETLQEAINYLADSLEPTDTELLDALDAAAPYGFRVGIRAGMFPLSQDELEMAEFYRAHFHGQKPVRFLLTHLLRELKSGNLTAELTDAN